MSEKKRICITLERNLIKKIDDSRDLIPRSTYIEAVITGKKGVLNET